MSSVRSLGWAKSKTEFSCVYAVVCLLAYAQSLSPHIRAQIRGISTYRDSASTFPGGGVTTLLQNEDGTMIAGTKKGRLFRSVKTLKDWREITGYATKYPLYSLATGTFGDVKRLFCGGGDRFISLWTEHSSEFQFQQALGPHTGWVKDLAFDQKKNLLFSIGCNCIETWDCSASPAIHLDKRSIENCPEKGSTLSSDLLCLCFSGDGRLLSGGVDGRIHCWYQDHKVASPQISASFHKGRVNDIVYVSQMDIFVSVGHDGLLAVFRLDDDSFVDISTLSIGAGHRLTCCQVVVETSKNLLVALGTSKGVVVLVTVTFDGNRKSLEFQALDRVSLEGAPAMIYSIVSYIDPRTSSNIHSILVAHATGIENVVISVAEDVD